MKLVLHWVAKDLRRLRGWVVAWGALVALPILVGIDVLRAEPLPSDWRRYREVLDWLNGLQALLGYIVTLLLVQEDRAIDARAFWPTRPMAAGRLLAAKLVFVLLVGVALPFLIQLPWWLACGVEPEGMASAMAEWTLLVFTIALPAALVAALTDSLGRAILWSFVVISAAVMVPMFGPLIRPTLSPRAWEAGLFALMVSLAIVLAAMGVAVALLYRKRRYSRALGAVAAVTVLGVMAVRILAGFWRVDREPAPWRPERAEAVVVTLHDAFSTATASRGAPEPLRQVRTGFAATNVPVDRALLGITSHQRWQWPGLALERDGLLAVLGRSGVPGLPGLTAPAPDPETAAWQVEERTRARRSGPRLLSQSTPPTEGIWIQANALAPASFAARMERDPPAYAARLWFTLVRPTLVNEQRLEGGAWQTGEAHAMRVVEAKDRGVDVVVTLVDAARASPWWRNVEVSILRARGQDARAAAGFILINRDRRESVGLFEEQQRALVVAGAQLTWRRLVTRQLAQLRAPNWETRPGWLDGASIAHVRSEREAVFRRDVSHPALPVKGASTEP